MGTFSLDISNWAKKAERNMHAAIRQTAFDIFRRVILKTPVLTGRLRANWGVQVGSPWTGTVDGVDESGGPTIAAAQGKVLPWNCRGSIFLNNNLPYAGAIEYGHSKQHPAGMVRVTLEEFPHIVQEKAREVNK
ncbi:MAG: hypothetical protein A2075_23380 [Geobacteraceae bacterium GWC2_58_44]|nr:MAG: hypothetical protein A2075_23380 [Geobacteraceae bacterium GWC2_58_44]